MLVVGLEGLPPLGLGWDGGSLPRCDPRSSAQALRVHPPTHTRLQGQYSKPPAAEARARVGGRTGRAWSVERLVRSSPVQGGPSTSNGVVLPAPAFVGEQSTDDLNVLTRRRQR